MVKIQPDMCAYIEHQPLDFHVVHTSCTRIVHEAVSEYICVVRATAMHVMFFLLQWYLV